MALIIKGRMPTCCGSCDASGTGACKAWMNHRKHLSDGIPSDCPIIGEIPDRHGRLKDAYGIMVNLRVTFCNDCENKECADCKVDKCWKIVREAPTIVEATNE